MKGKLGRTGWAVREVQRGGELIGGVWEMVGTGSVDGDEEGVRNEGRKRRIPEQCRFGKSGFTERGEWDFRGGWIRNRDLFFLFCLFFEGLRCGIPTGVGRKSGGESADGDGISG